jgi:membrane protein YdbS with pleckstrin-like domain
MPPAAVPFHCKLTCRRNPLGGGLGILIRGIFFRRLRKILSIGLLRTMTDPAADRNIQAIDRPDSALWKYYLLVCLAFPPAFPFAILPMYFRYHTMRYKFSDDGISMRWGILFRREIIVNYARIQDIHLKSNIVERWLGLARILVQTASGNQSAELTIEGIKEFELLRDFLYSRMRGVKDSGAITAAHVPSTSESAVFHVEELTAVLREATQELRAIREAFEHRESIANCDVTRAPRPEASRHV